MKIIKVIDNTTSIEIGSGRFDNHCVFINQNGNMYAPKDIDLFNFLNRMLSKHSSKDIYDDFLIIYNNTTKDVDYNVLDSISSISNKYDDAFEYEKWMTVLYLSLIAEENKENTRLGKKIKRLGIHQLLFDNYSSYEAARFSIGKRATELLYECGIRGF